MSERTYGLGRGEVYPAGQARHLLNPLRHLTHPPRRLARRAGLAPGARVLELGSGPGWFSPALTARLPSGRLHLMDLQPGMLHNARRRAGERATATAGDALALPFRGESFDTVVTAAVLGEVPDPPEALAEIARVLRGGGRLVALETRTDPDFVPLNRLRELAAGAGLDLHRRHGLPGYTATFVKRS